MPDLRREVSVNDSAVSDYYDLENNNNNSGVKNVTVNFDMPR